MSLRLFITGGSSYLGQHLVPMAVENSRVRYSYWRHNPLTLAGGQQLDIRDRSALLAAVTAWQPHCIIHTAGSNRPRQKMRETIELGATHITAAAATVGARLIHLSTDALFNGREAPYRETDAPSPIHEYGRAKAEAERIVASYTNHVIIRTSLIYSLRLMDRSTEWITADLKAGRTVRLFTNQQRQPVAADTLSAACLELVTHPFTGIINVAGSQVLSRADFGIRLLDYWGGADRERLLCAPCEDPQQPLDCRLDIQLAQQLLQTPLPGVDELLGSDDS